MLQVQNVHHTCTKGLVALGSNLSIRRGGVRGSVLFALELLESESVEVVAQSRLFRTPAFPKGAGPDFVNAAVAVQSSLSPGALMRRLHEIEAEAGRTRQLRWEARVLDLDLLACGDLVLPSAGEYARWRDLPAEAQMQQAPGELILPHPRMQDRGFVLVPLMDIAPDWVHPVLGKTVRQMLAGLDPAELVGIEPLAGSRSFGEGASGGDIFGKKEA